MTSDDNPEIMRSISEKVTIKIDDPSQPSIPALDFRAPTAPKMFVPELAPRPRQFSIAAHELPEGAVTVSERPFGAVTIGNRRYRLMSPTTLCGGEYVLIPID